MEMEGTVPAIWVDVTEKSVRWPNKKVKYCFLNHVVPKEDWATYRLVKVKFTSGNLILLVVI